MRWQRTGVPAWWPAMARRLVLASASPARLRLLEQAGFAPEVRVSGVDETVAAGLSADETAVVLAERKAAAVATVLTRTAGERVGESAETAGAETAGADQAASVVVGCDSVLSFAGEVWGKATDVADAERRWRAMRGRDGVLVTGHCVIDMAALGGDDQATADGGEPTGPGVIRRRSGVVVGAASTVVRFGDPSDDEVAAYVATGEPLHVAGGFTLDGRSAPFIEGVDGDPGNVIGLSLPLLRRLLRELGITVVELWA